MAERGKTRAKSAGVYVALLRGINVGGNNRLPMKDLVAIFEAAGCREVSSYIQSGNVAFCAPARSAGRVAERVAELIDERFGYQVPVVLRSREELRAVVSANPWLKDEPAGASLDALDPRTLHVGFLAAEPSAAARETLDPARSQPDAFMVCGREIYLRLPNGVGRSKLTNAYFDSKLKTTSTMRNWRTVLKLLELADAY